MSSSIKTNQSCNLKHQEPKTPHSDPSIMAPDNFPPARARKASTGSTSTTNDDETVFFDTVTMTKFDKFQAKIFPIVTKISTLKQHQEQPFVILWKQALAKPGNTLTSDSTFRSLHKILPVENLHDYKRFLQECPSIETYVTFQDSNKTTAGFEVYFNEDKIKGLLEESTDLKLGGDATTLSSFEMVNDNVTEPSKTDTVTTEEQEPFQECYGTKTDFKPLWTQVCFILNTFASENIDDPITLKWKEWQKRGLTLRSDFQQVKKVTNLDSLAELFFFLRECAPVTEFLEIQWDNKIKFRQRQEPVDQLAESVLMQPVETATLTTAESTTHLVSPTKVKPAVHDSEPCTKVNNDVPTTPFIDMIRDAADIDPSETLDYYTVNEDTIITSDEFRIFHSHVCDIIDKWVSQADGTKEGFVTTWRRWKFHGLDRTRDFRFVQRLLRIEDLNGYLMAIKACPEITKQVGWLWYQNELRYWIIPRETLKESAVVEVNQTRLQNLQTEFTLFQNKFELSIKDFNAKLADVQYRLDINDNQVRRVAKLVQGNVNQAIETGKVSINQTMEAQKDIFQRKLTHLMDTNATEFRSTIQGICKSHDTHVKAELDQFSDQTTERILKELYAAADDATNSFNAQVEIATARFLSQVQKATTSTESAMRDQPIAAKTNPTPADSRWKNVDQATRDKLAQFVASSPNGPSYTPPTDPPPAGNQGGIPTTIENPAGVYNYNSPDGLPWLQFDQLLKRSKAIQYSGQSDIIVFYNQLYNITNNYGVYMRKLQTLQLGMSICPDTYNDIPISETRRAQMGNCMYQILQNPDVIPTEFTWARNIISRFSEDNDGYKVLYAMVKPILNKDTVITAPMSIECNDIHEYSKKFNSYIKCEQLAGRLYSPREQVTLFLNGLDKSFAYAISRVETLMDTGTTGESSLPDLLSPEQLPDTVDKYFQQGIGQPTIRAMMGARGQDRRGESNYRANTKGKPTAVKPTAKVDKPCSVCSAWGHLRSQCGGFARHLIFQKASTTIDETLKTKIVNNYKAEMKLKAEAKMKSQRLGTVRQMWEQGLAFEEVEENLMAVMMPENDNPFTGASDDEDVE